MYSPTPKSKIFRIIGIVIAVLGAIGSIGSGFLFQTPRIKEGLYGTYTVGTDFNYIVMIAGFLSIGLLCLFIFGIAFILEFLEKIEKQLSEIDIKDPINKPLFKNISNALSSALIAQKLAESDEWKCPNCGKINKNYVGTCGCGQHK